MEQTKEFALTLDDRPGTLAKATDALAKAGINIEGYCAVPSGKDGKGTFRVVTSDPATTRKALETAGFAENELNVGPTYSITRNRIAISADDFSKLRESLQEVAPVARRK